MTNELLVEYKVSSIYCIFTASPRFLLILSSTVMLEFCTQAIMDDLALASGIHHASIRMRRHLADDGSAHT